MKREFSLPIASKLPRRLRLKAPHAEFIRYVLMGGGDLYAEFAFELIPIPLSEIKVVIHSAEEWEIDRIESGVRSAFADIISKYEQRGIEFAGLELVIENYRSHIIDSKPVGYGSPLMKRIYELIAEHQFELEVLEFELNAPIFQLTELGEFDRRNALYPSSAIYLSCPRIYDESLVFEKHWQASFLLAREGMYGASIRLSAKVFGLYQRRRINRLAIHFANELPYPLVDAIVSEIRAFKQSVYKRGYNLGGLTIFIEGTQELEKHPERIFNAMGWLLLNLVANKENYSLQPA